MFWRSTLIFLSFQFSLFCKAQVNNSIWMEQLLPQIGHLHLYDITLPGTHDAASFVITSALSPDPAGDPLLDEIIKIAEAFGIPVEDIIIPWATAQNRTLFDQAQDGMRYFDLRAAFNGTHWYSYHFDLGLSIEEHLTGLRLFLLTHPSEILIIEVSHFSATNLTQYELDILRDLILKLLSPWLCPRTKDFSSMTIGEMIATNQRVIVTFSSENTIENYPQFWPPSTMINSYANSDNVTKMIEYNHQQVQDFNELSSLPTNALYKLSWTLTPQPSTIVDSFLPGTVKSLKELAAIGNKQLGAFARPITTKGWRLCQILLIDFEDQSDIMPIILRSIQEILKTLSYRDLGELRRVHPHWDELCGQLLNSGYYALINKADVLLQDCQKRVYNEKDLQTAITALTNLQVHVLNPVDMMRAPMDEGVMCFPYGHLLDKAFELLDRVERVVQGKDDPETAVLPWQRLAELSRKAQVHYRKHVEPEVEKRMGEVTRLQATARLQRIDSFLVETTVNKLERDTEQARSDLGWEIEQLKAQNAQLKKDNRELKQGHSKLEGRIEALERKFKTVARLLQ